MVSGLNFRDCGQTEFAVEAFELKCEFSNFTLHFTLIIRHIFNICMKKTNLLALGTISRHFAAAADMGGDGGHDDKIATEHKHQDHSACNRCAGEHAHKDEIKKDDMKKGDER